MAIDRVENWKRFSKHMEEYIQNSTVNKYKMEDEEKVDLMAITKKPIVCIWNILRYSLRIWNGKMKEHDLEKIAHYSELAWSIAGGNRINNKRDDMKLE